MTPDTDHLNLIFRDGTAQTFVLPAAPPPGPGTPPQLYRQRHDYELYPTTFAARPAEVFRLNPFDHTLLNKALQEMWFGQIKIEGAGLSFEILAKTWQWLTRSNCDLTNGQGTDRRRDYILNVRMGEPLPGIFPLGLGGNVYVGTEEVYRGEKSLRVTTLSQSYIPTDLSHANYPWLIHYGTVTTSRKLSNGTYAVIPFSTNYWQGRNAPQPLVASEPVWIGMDMLEKLPAGARPPSPYNPPRP